MYGPQDKYKGNKLKQLLAILLSGHVEVDSSLFVSERISGVRCQKLRHYFVIPFFLSLSAYSELSEIKTFIVIINLAQSCMRANPGANVCLCHSHWLAFMVSASLHKSSVSHDPSEIIQAC